MRICFAFFLLNNCIALIISASQKQFTEAESKDSLKKEEKSFTMRNRKKEWF